MHVCRSVARVEVNKLFIILYSNDAFLEANWEKHKLSSKARVFEEHSQFSNDVFEGKVHPVYDSEPEEEIDSPPVVIPPPSECEEDGNLVVTPSGSYVPYFKLTKPKPVVLSNSTETEYGPPQPKKRKTEEEMDSQISEIEEESKYVTSASGSHLSYFKKWLKEKEVPESKMRKTEFLEILDAKKPKTPFQGIYFT